MINLNDIAEDLFNKIRSRYSNVKMGDENGKVTSEAELARFLDFEYTSKGETLGHVNVSLSEEDGLVVYYSSEFVSEEDDQVRSDWYGFLKELRMFSKKRMLNFDTRDITKSNLDKRDYQFLATPNGDTPMSESKLYGSSRKSYQDLSGATMIVTHTKSINAEQAGGRSMHIENIFIENTDGERFKYPLKHLNGARALGRHVANGGTPYDAFGSHIIEMSQELGKLRKFKTYMGRSGVMAEAMGPVSERVNDRIAHIKKEVTMLQRESYYKDVVEGFEVSELSEVPDDVKDQWVEALTIKSFKEELQDVFPYVYKLVSETESLDANDLTDDEEEAAADFATLASQEDQEDGVEESITIALEKTMGRFSSVVESNSLFSTDEEEAEQSVTKLQKLIGDHFPAGVDGMNAIESLQGLIDDPMLTDMLRKVGEKDSDMCVRPLIHKYVKAKDEAMLSKLDFGDLAVDECGPDDSMEQDEQKTPLGEFILSYFDRQEGAFPKGETAVLTMVEKEYGDQYVKPAQQFIGRLHKVVSEYSVEEDSKRWKQTSMDPKLAILKFGADNVKIKKGGLNNGKDMVSVLTDDAEQDTSIVMEPTVAQDEDLSNIRRLAGL